MPRRETGPRTADDVIGNGVFLTLIGAIATAFAFANDDTAGVLVLSATSLLAGSVLLVGLIAKGIEIGLRSSKSASED